MKLAICGDSQQVLKKIPDNFVDLICTDPPYGIKFMGKDWDKAIPKKEIWSECLRVLKPGAFAFVMCTPRQDCLSRMIVSLEDVGFWVNFTSILWTYAQGFPKSQNLSKAADKRAGAEREVVGVKTTPDGKPYTDRRPINKDKEGWDRPWKNDPEKWETQQMETLPATPEAKALDGAYGGFQPKPAVEIILVVMKPPTYKTWLDQALDNGKGCSWLDDGRIPTEPDFKPIPAGPRGKGAFGDGGKWERRKNIVKDDALRSREGEASRNRRYSEKGGTNFAATPGPRGGDSSGRFPANLLVLDDVLNDGKVTKSSGGKGNKSGFVGVNVYGDYKRGLDAGCHSGGLGDIGSFSRYFSLDSWWDKRLESLPESVKKTFPFLLTPKASKSEKTHKKQIENRHPTVKPLKLMSWLISLGSREGDLVVDPFVGSGTTCLAAKILNREYLGVDVDPESVKITKERLALI